MPRRQRLKSESGYYHIMLRGNERKNIFQDEDDKLQFLETLSKKKEDSNFFLHAFCLMDNHVHLMLSEEVEDIAKIMKRITVSYVHYFNNKYKRVGHLFQDRFRSEVVEDNSYIIALARYIHQNPVKSGIVRSADEYKWSSYDSYLNENNYFAKFIATEIVLGIFSDDKKTAINRFQEYTKGEAQEAFIDIVEESGMMAEEEAKTFFKKMLLMGSSQSNCANTFVPDDLIKEFRGKTNLSIRKIAEITGLNKDRVSRILKS
jgi:REP element-mobilizing transposase RayT